MRLGTYESVTVRVCIASQTAGRVKVYVTGVLVEGRIVGLLVTCDGVGTTLRGLLDNWCEMVRMALDAGVGLGEIREKMALHEYEPKGVTDCEDPRLRFARSVVDWAVRWAGFVEEGSAEPEPQRGAP